jgi:hypothetical protein
MGGIVKIGRWLIVAGSVVLFLTALLHGSGYLQVSRVLETSDMKPFLTGGFKALWLMFSIHLLVLSAIFIVAGLTPKGRRLVLLCTLIPACDTTLLFHFVGVFIGTIALAVATLLFLAGGLLLPQGEATQ